VNVIRYALENQIALVQERNRRGQTPLHIAAQQGRKESVELLLPLFPIRDNDGKNALHAAAIGNQIDLVILLIEQGINPFEGTG
ncbi:ankyrin repeat domain-containing protein, partial [Klebsiella pneumoniae]|nr:ankyrin repeat domain-containing protein [Klebsiella pneumoniae]